MTCPCEGTSPGWPEHEFACDKYETDPLECSCYDFESMEYGPDYPCGHGLACAVDHKATP